MLAHLDLAAEESAEVARVEHLGDGPAAFRASFAQHQDMGEGGHDFLDVMGDEDERGRAGLDGEVFEEMEEILAGDRVESGAGLVENQEARAGHEGAGDGDRRALALGEHRPRAVFEGGAADGLQEAFGGGPVGAAWSAPEIDHRVAPEARRENRAQARGLGLIRRLGGALRGDLLREGAGMPNEHLPTEDSGEPVVYQLRVKGHLGAQWGAWFGGMTVTQTANGETLITGLVADQAALYGLLRTVRDLGLPLLALSSSERTGPDGFAADSGDLPGA